MVSKHWPVGWLCGELMGTDSWALPKIPKQNTGVQGKTLCLLKVPSGDLDALAGLGFKALEHLESSFCPCDLKGEASPETRAWP